MRYEFLLAKKNVWVWIYMNFGFWAEFESLIQLQKDSRNYYIKT